MLTYLPWVFSTAAIVASIASVLITRHERIKYRRHMNAADHRILALKEENYRLSRQLTHYRNYRK